MSKIDFENLFRAFGSALGEALSENGKFRFERGEDDEWDSFEEARLTDASPAKLKVALRKTDTVRVTTGEKLAMTVSGGEAAEAALQFRITEDEVKIVRRKGADHGPLAIAVTMPAPSHIAIGGAGVVEAESMAGDATIAIGGSGTVRVAALDAERLDAKIGGSGTMEVAGSVGHLALKIGGSGHFMSPRLEAREVRIAIGGSGEAEIASDGDVEAKIGGSGDITVHGNPRCSLRAGGSGRLRTVPRSGPGEPMPEAA